MRVYNADPIDTMTFDTKIGRQPRLGALRNENDPSLDFNLRNNLVFVYYSQYWLSNTKSTTNRLTVDVHSAVALM